MSVFKIDRHVLKIISVTVFPRMLCLLHSNYKTTVAEIKIFNYFTIISERCKNIIIFNHNLLSKLSNCM